MFVDVCPKNVFMSIDTLFKLNLENKCVHFSQKDSLPACQISSVLADRAAGKLDCSSPFHEEAAIWSQYPTSLCTRFSLDLLAKPGMTWHRKCTESILFKFGLRLERKQAAGHSPSVTSQKISLGWAWDCPSDPDALTFSLGKGIGYELPEKLPSGRPGRKNPKSTDWGDTSQNADGRIPRQSYEVFLWISHRPK